MNDVASSPRASTPGLGDPYWYEWSVGLKHIVRMLSPESGISSVTLQASEVRGVDDVLVKRAEGPSLYIQVKHSRADETLTFSALVAPEGKGKLSLLEQLAIGWSDTPEGTERETVLFTNRPLGNRKRTIKAEDGDYIRPPLDQFWSELSDQLTAVGSLEELTVRDEWKPALTEFLATLESIANAEALRFLKSLRIEASQPDLVAIKDELLRDLSTVFGIPEGPAASLLARLHDALRDWTTSLRAREAITREDVLRALSAPPPESLPDHRLPPPEPFFESRGQFLRDLESALNTRSSPVIFLTGEPGAGKTSLVSALTNRQEPLITARFHAFRPLLPGDTELPPDGGRTTTSTSLWYGLLDQLRERFLTMRKLDHYSVPVQNSFLSAEEARSHVLRIAEEFARDSGRTVALAIDGLDHAARAGSPTTFLDALVQPESVPDGVCFLVAGQPVEGYADKYPSWLVAPEPGLVQTFSVPGVSEEDVASLVANANPTKSGETIEALACVVAEFAKGSTLAAAFGAHESASADSPTELHARLVDRSLGSGLREYYATIWGAAAEALESRVELLGELLAAAFSLSSLPLTGEALAGAIAENDLGADRWTAALDRLAPLVVRTDNGYRLLHNDVRVYLTGVTQGKQERARGLAADLARFYLSSRDHVVEAHADGMRFLQIANDRAEFVRRVDPVFVLEGWAIGRPLVEIEEQCELATRFATELQDWTAFRRALTSCATSAQLSKSLELREDNVPALYPDLHNVLLASERDVVAEDQWDVDVIYSVVQDVDILLRGEQRDRARGLLRRWLGQHSPSSLTGLLESTALDEHPASGDKRLTQEFASSLRVWGRCASALNFQVKLDWSDDLEADAVGHFAGGVLESASRQGSTNDWARSLRSLRGWRSDDLLEVGWWLCRHKEWSRVGVLVQFVFDLRPRLSASALAQICAFCALLGFNVEDLVGKLSYSDLSSPNGDPDLRAIASLALARGWHHPSYPASDVAMGLDAVLQGRRLGAKEEKQLAAWLVACAGRMGQRLRWLFDGSEIDSYLASDVGALLDNNARRVFVPGSPQVVQDLVSVGLYCAREAGGDSEADCRDLAEGVAKRHTLAISSRAVFDFLLDCGDHSVAEDWTSSVLGTDGGVWALSVDERAGVVEEFTARARQLGLSQVAEAASAKSRWGAIGYAGHKEYGLETLLEWFASARELDSEGALDLGLRLLGVSRGVSERGDNRTGWRIKEEVGKSACDCGAGEVWRLASERDEQAAPWIELGSNALLGSLRALVESGRLSDSELLGFWCYCTGTLWWADMDECSQLRLAARSLRQSAPHLEGALNDLFPHEHAICSSEGWPTDNYQSEALEPSPDRDALRQAVSDPSVDLGDAIGLLEGAVRQSGRHSDGGIWDGVVAACARIGEARAVKQRSRFARRLLDVLLETENRYQWSHTGTREAVRALVPHLSDAEVWELAGWLLTREPRFGSALWLSSLYEDGAWLTLCRWRSSREFVWAYLGELLDMHQVWMEGGGRLSCLPMPVGAITQGPAPRSWTEFFLRALYENLDTDSLVEARCALRGLHGLVRACPEGFAFSDQLWRMHRDAKLWFLLLLEKIALTNGRIVEEFGEFIEDCRSGQGARLAVQAWLVLATHERAQGGESLPLVSAAAKDDSSTLLLPPRRLLATVVEQKGTVAVVSGSNSVLSELRMLRVVTREDLGDIESSIARKLELPVPDSPLSRRRSRHRFGDLVRAKSRVSDVADEEVLRALQSGRWKGVPDTWLAQAILPIDEPHVLLGEWSLAEDWQEWLSEDALEAAVISGRDAVRSGLRSQLSLGLKPNQVLLAGAVTAFSRTKDAELVVHHFVRRSPLLTEAAYPTSFGCRSFALYDSSRFQPSSSEVDWLTYSAGGLTHFLASALKTYPSSLWQEELGWTPDPQNPLIWWDGEEVVARFEVRWGPPRQLSREDAYRLPKLERWVCTRAALDAAAERLGAVFVPREFLQLEDIGSR